MDAPLMDLGKMRFDLSKEKSVRPLFNGLSSEDESFRDSIESFNENVSKVNIIYYDSIYSFVKSGLLNVAKDFSTKNGFDSSSLLLSSLHNFGFDQIIEYFGKKLHLDDHFDSSIFKEYDFVKECISNITHESGTKGSYLSELLSKYEAKKDIFLLDNKLNVSQDYLRQFIYEVISLNEMLRKSITSYYEDMK
jgi:hypothetical protein